MTKIKGRKFHIIVFGCQMNYSDSARIKAVLMNSGFTYVESITEANIVIFDTCSVRQKSEDKVTGKLKEVPTDKKVRITGCMIQHHLRHGKISDKSKKKKIKGLMTTGNFTGTVATKNPDMIGFSSEDINSDLLKNPKLDPDNIVYVNHAFNPVFFNLNHQRPNIELFFRIDDTGFIPLMARHLGYEVNPDADVTNEYTQLIPKHSTPGTIGNSTTSKKEQKLTRTAYVPISTGCSQFCAFCIVPYARGLEKHLPAEQVIDEAKQHIQNGIQEIVLLGQIVNKHPDFVYICREILKLEGLRWLRYTSPYPTHYSDELLALHQNEEKMCPHIHMPLQSGSDTILRKMFRGYNVKEFKGFVDKIRNLSRPISITTDIIVGFCDETAKDFQESIDLTQYSEFDMVYIGIYSDRKGTYAHRKYEDNIPLPTKKERHAKLNKILIDVSTKNNIKEHGLIKPVMITKTKGDIVKGYTDNMKNIILSNVPEDLKTGDFVQAKIIDSKPFLLYGEIIHS